MNIQLRAQNTTQNVPFTFGRAVLVSIQATFLPLITKVVGNRDDDTMRAVLNGLDMDEMIEWNQSIWIPEQFGKFINNWVFTPGDISKKRSRIEVPAKGILQLQAGPSF